MTIKRLLGSAPSQVSTNKNLGGMAFQDAANITQINVQQTTDTTNIGPSLLLDFANSEALDPRITFSRPTTAVFYNGISSAIAEQNLILYSQELDNAAWTKSSTTVIANYATAPDGTITADALYETTANVVNHIANPVLVAAQPTTATFSVYLKKGDGATAPDWIQITSGGGSNAYANFNLTTGLVGNSGNSAITPTITSVGNGWYRCTLTMNTITTGVSFILCFTNNTDPTQRYAATAYAGLTTSNVYVWGAQSEQRSAVTAYTPTTTAVVTNYIPTLLTAAAGVARFDHNPITGESLGLLIEEQRVNLLTYSADFSNAAWTKGASTVTSAANIAPDGTQTATLLVENTSTTDHKVYQNFTYAATVYTASVYAKAANRSWVVLLGVGATAYFNLSTGVLGTVTGSTATITPVGNGWYRCTMTFTATAGANFFQILATTTDNVQAYTGNGFSSIFLWGAQLEAGYAVTSYIPTVASQVTRSADISNMTGANFSSWYNQAQGTTVFIGSNTGAVSNGDRQPVYYVYLRGSTNVREMLRNVLTNNIVFNGTTSGITFNNVATNGTIVNTSSSYTSTTLSGAVNGSAAVTINQPTVTPDSFGISRNGYQLNGHIKKIAYYPRALSNAELQEMTA